VAIQQSEIFNGAVFSRSGPQRAAERTAFLSHSHRDERLALSLQGFLAQQGVHLYIDWQDSTMPEIPNSETADKIRTKIRQCHYFLYLATENSKDSRWCPWELGFADGVKKHEKIYVIPTSNARGSYGTEYVDLYRRIDRDAGGLGVYLPTHHHYAETLSRAFA
jgi:hypothetical protein